MGDAQHRTVLSYHHYQNYYQGNIRCVGIGAARHSEGNSGSENPIGHN